MAGLVAAGLVRGLVDYAAGRGADRAGLLQAAGAVEVSLDGPDARAPLEAYLRLISAARIALDDPALPLRWAEAVGMAELSVVGLVMEASATMGEAFAQMQRYGRLAMDPDGSGASPFALVRDGDGLRIEDRRLDPALADLVDIAFVRLTCGPRRFLPQPHVLRVELARDDVGLQAEYARIFACPVAFGAPRNALHLHPDTAGWPVARNGFLKALLEQHADARLSELDSRTSWRRRVEAVLMEALPAGSTSIDRVAARLGFSRQTLFRRLKAEGVTYEEVLNRLRERLARSYLRAHRFSVTDTAFLLGYREPASFTRAFHRWAGQSPVAFVRAQEQAGAGR